MKCPLCPLEVSKQGMNKHIFSCVHKQDLLSLLHSRKPFLDKYIKNYENGVVDYLPYVTPDPKKISVHMSLCFGCKSAYHCGSTKSHSCKQFKEGIETLKGLLNSQPINLEQPEILIVKSEKKEFECQTEPMVQPASKIDSCSLDIKDFLRDILDEMKDKSESFFIKKMIQFQESYPDGFDKVLTSYGDESEEILYLMKQQEEA